MSIYVYYIDQYKQKQNKSNRRYFNHNHMA